MPIFRPRSARDVLETGLSKWEGIKSLIAESLIIAEPIHVEQRRSKVFVYGWIA